MKRMFIIGKDAFLVTTMRVALRYSSDITVFGVRDSGDSVSNALREARPDIALLDGSVPVERTLERIAQIEREQPHAIVLVIATTVDPAALEQLMESGATVCLSRSLNAAHFEALLSASDDGAGAPSVAAPVADAAPAPTRPSAPQTPLTNRELEILRCVAEGHTNARIGRDLWVTEQTVKFHLSNIYRKLGVSNRTEASRYVLLNDLMPARPAAPAPPALEGNGPIPALATTKDLRVNGAPVNGHRSDALHPTR